MKENIILLTDAYKLTHHLQYPEGLTKLYSYGESRIGSKYNHVCFFGLQMILKDHFCCKVDDEMIEEAEQEAFYTFGTTSFFNKEVWKRVRDLGYLPMRVKAVPEGSRVGIDNVLFTLESTEPWFATTLNAMESVLMHVWYPTTIATRSMHIKEAIKPFYKNTGTLQNLEFAVNDFGLRGATGTQAAIRGGAAHLIHFQGSDNNPASRAIKQYYQMEGRLKSVWATEHSVATSFGPGEGEMEYVRHQLRNCEPNKISSIVIDSYDSDNFVQNVIGSEEISELIKARPGRIVLRPDSNDPLTNLLKYSDVLGGIFGYSINQKGYKVLNNNVGLIQGDGMDEESIPELYKQYTQSGWSADNIVTGSGGGLLQVDANRDTQRFAIKAAYGEKNGVPFDIQKNPKSDTTKKSKSGRLKLHPTAQGFITISSSKETPQQFEAYHDAMETVFENGKVKTTHFQEIINRAQ